MSRLQSLEQTYTSSKGSSDMHATLPLLSKIEDMHIRNLQGIISMFCQLISQMAKTIDLHDIQFTNQLAAKMIINIKDANNQIKYHQKINPGHRQTPSNITSDIDHVLQLLAKLKTKEGSDSSFPKVKKDDNGQPSSFIGQLSTITEKQSEQNLHNYLKSNLGGKKRSKSNVNKNTFLFNTSSIEDIEFQVIREQTRKSLDNPYFKNNQNRKNLYNDLQRIKGQDNLLPVVKSYLDKHKKIGNSLKSPQYVIQKLI